jgi:hypothetical protein
MSKKSNLNEYFKTIRLPANPPTKVFKDKKDSKKYKFKIEDY